MTALVTKPLGFTIANGASVSEALRLNGGMVEAIIMPASWTAAGLSFQSSETEAGSYLPLFDALGDEITLTVAAGRTVILPLATVRGVDWLKLVSGTSALAVNQGAARTITVLTRTYG
jgi:hypothetical protein